MYVRTLSCALQSHGFGAWHPTLEINTQADQRDFIDFTIHTVQEHTYVYIACLLLPVTYICTGLIYPVLNIVIDPRV